MYPQWDNTISSTAKAIEPNAATGWWRCSCILRFVMADTTGKAHVYILTICVLHLAACIKGFARGLLMVIRVPKLLLIYACLVLTSTSFLLATFVV